MTLSAWRTVSLNVSRLLRSHGYNPNDFSQRATHLDTPIIIPSQSHDNEEGIDSNIQQSEARDSFKLNSNLFIACNQTKSLNNSGYHHTEQYTISQQQQQQHHHNTDTPFAFLLYISLIILIIIICSILTWSIYSIIKHTQKVRRIKNEIIKKTLPRCIKHQQTKSEIITQKPTHAQLKELNINIDPRANDDIYAWYTLNKDKQTIDSTVLTN